MNNVIYDNDRDNDAKVDRGTATLLRSILVPQDISSRREIP